MGWLGISQELSPASLHLGLLERGGDVERFLRDAHREVDVTFLGEDPKWDDGRFREWAAGYDIFFMTDPPDLGSRSEREFMRAYQERLSNIGWQAPALLGTFERKAPSGMPRAVHLYASRPTP